MDVKYAFWLKYIPNSHLTCLHAIMAHMNLYMYHYQCTLWTFYINLSFKYYSNIKCKQHLRANCRRAIKAKAKSILWIYSVNKRPSITCLWWCKKVRGMGRKKQESMWKLVKQQLTFKTSSKEDEICKFTDLFQELLQTRTFKHSNIVDLWFSFIFLQPIDIILIILLCEKYWAENDQRKKRDLIWR